MAAMGNRSESSNVSVRSDSGNGAKAAMGHRSNGGNRSKGHNGLQE